MAGLNAEMNARIPAWYVELLTSIPICGLELEWQADVPDDEDDGIAWIEWCGVKGIRSESLECYPGRAILERGYINVASDSTGGGDPYFIPTDQEDDPPVYQVFHDMGDQADQILAEGRQLIAPSLSDFFRFALAKEI
jgi:hypothetical protein